MKHGTSASAHAAMRLLLLPAVAMIVAISAVCNGCTSASDNVTLDSLTWSDSIVFSSTSHAKVDLNVHYIARGPKALRDSVSRWICEAFGDSTASRSAELKDFIADYGRNCLKDDSAEITAEFDDIPNYFEYALDRSVSVIFEDEQFITFCVQTYRYCGGAHGSTINDYATFRKSDGHLMGWDLLAGLSRNDIADRIKQGLRSYFELSDDDSLVDCLLLDAIDEAERDALYENNFPLPSTLPYIVNDSVAIIYQQYEIACYAAGMPSCFIAPKPASAGK